MSAMPSSLVDLLQPISSERPAGDDLRWTAEWDRVREARRADDGLAIGKWQKKDSKSSDWRLVQQLATVMLQSQSKDLQLALWLTEANVKLQGFVGLRDGLQLVNGLMRDFWDRGLFPPMEDGPEDRVGPFEWLNEKLVDSLVQVPLTRRQGSDFHLLQLRDARMVGSETSWRTEDGEIDDEKQRAYTEALAAGRTSLDMFQRALSETPRTEFEALRDEFEQSYIAFKDLEALLGERFGDLAPSTRDFRAVMNEIRQELDEAWEKKQRQEPRVSSIPKEVSPLENDSRTEGSFNSDSIRIRLPLTVSTSQSSTANSFWQEAERLVRSGQVDKGLSEMIRLAASETSGRNRFERKLLLAEVCLSSKRERLARTILEELAEVIDRLQLETWETSELIAGVWTRLYEIYRKSSPDSERAAKLYERLCRLDPWQALACSE